MKINSDFRDLLLLLNEEKVEYLLVGGYAVILHSEPRYTKDLDIWVRPERRNAEKVYKALTKFGAPLVQLDVQVDDFVKEDYFVQLGREPARVDILMGVKGLAFDQAWKNKVLMKLGDVVVNVIARTDLIDAKLEAGRPQDLIDAKNLRQSKKQEQVDT